VRHTKRERRDRIQGAAGSKNAFRPLDTILFILLCTAFLGAFLFVYRSDGPPRDSAAQRRNARDASQVVALGRNARRAQFEGPASPPDRVTPEAVGLQSNDGFQQPILSDAIQPDPRKTPGAVDTSVQGEEICTGTWAAGNPPRPGGSLTYSKAARHTSASVKERAFLEYGIENPHDGGRTYEVDHRVPLSLGGRDVLENLWPETRKPVPYSAWVKDRLEYRLWNLVCHPEPGETPVQLEDAQRAFLGDWTAAFQKYCPTESACPSFGGEGR
jgi:hypothetical protein